MGKEYSLHNPHNLHKPNNINTLRRESRLPRPSQPSHNPKFQNCRAIRNHKLRRAAAKPLKSLRVFDQRKFRMAAPQNLHSTLATGWASLAGPGQFRPSKIPLVEDSMNRPIYEIAAEISKDWRKPYFGAVPYLQAMHCLVDHTSKYGVEDYRGIIRYFLYNAGTWKGDTAKRIKAELRSIVA